MHMLEMHTSEVNGVNDSPYRANMWSFEELFYDQLYKN